jgi:DNA helicase-2/ATP-dependent DNA helicase PcrA
MSLDFARALNPQQYRACTATGAPVLILAGAGSGKTRVLTHRMVYLTTELGVPPAQLLAVTFTNKAANEMRERAVALMERAGHPSPRIPWIGTFHSICARLLRQYGALVKLSPGFTIYDEDDALAILRDCARDRHLPDDRAILRALAHFIDGCKNAGEGPDLTRELASGPFEAKRAEVYALYNQRLRGANAVDFGDLILLVTQLLSAHEPTRQRIAQTWQQLLVDEFQDTNGVQYSLLRLLCRDHQALTVVGDDDQSIYAWRGANVNYMLNFTDDFPNAITVKLEQNYRSTPSILKVAGDLVENNRARHPKRLWTDIPHGDPVRLYTATDEHDEARFIARSIHALRRAHLSEQPLGAAILFRTHAQSRVLEEALRNASLPYRLVGGFSFYNRLEIKDMLAYMRLLVNDTDLLALRRVINVPTRGIGEKNLAAIEQFITNEAQGNIWMGLHAIATTKAGAVPPRARAAVASLFGLLQGWRAAAEADPPAPPSALLQSILRDTEYLDFLARRDPDRATETSENVRELISALHDFERAHANPTLLQFLEDSLLNALPDDAAADAPDAVQLMTIHSAKGLEFDAVFVAGFEQFLMPLQRPGDAPDNLEEERRLAYVAFTRARQHLTLCGAQMRRIYGQTRYPQPSLFLHEVDPRDLRALGQGVSSASSAPAPTPRAPAFGAPRPAPRGPSPASVVRAPQPAPSAPAGGAAKPSPFAGVKGGATPSRSGASAGALAVGDAVNHARFGRGTVKGVEARAGQVIATVDFPLAGVKKVVSSFLDRV